MATKFSEKLLALIAQEDIIELHKYFSRNQGKTQNMAFCVKAILDKKGFDFYIKSCLEWSKKNPQTERIFVEYALKYYLINQKLTFHS